MFVQKCLRTFAISKLSSFRTLNTSSSANKTHRILINPVRDQQLTVKYNSIKSRTKLELLDGSKSVGQFNTIWLRDSCRCPNCLNPDTKTKSLNAADIDLNKLELVDHHTKSDNQLIVNWREVDSDGQSVNHVSSYDLNWLRTIAKSGYKYSSTDVDGVLGAIRKSSLPKPILWNSKTINSVSKSLETSFESFMDTSNPTGLKQSLSNLIQYGVTKLNGAELNQGTISLIANRISYARETSFGRTFQVKFEPNPVAHLAYRDGRLNHHTDLPYRQSSPGVQLLHCLANADIGGKSFLVDGFEVAEQLRSQSAEQFEVLKSTKVPFSYFDAISKSWLRAEKKVIRTKLDLDSNLETVNDIHYNDFLMRPPIGDHEHLDKFYRAYQNFTRLLRAKENQFEFLMTPGDVIIFNNRRVLHGREAFEVKDNQGTGSGRHLEGCYLDFDEVLSRFEQLNDESA